MNYFNRQLIIFSTIIYIVIGIQTGLKAQKCSLEKNEIDALTEFVIKRTAPEMILRLNGQPLYVKAQCIGPHKYLKILFYKYNDFSFEEDREIGLVLSNNDEIILYPRQVPVDSTKMDVMADVNALLVYKLSNNQYETLCQNTVIKFKYYLVSGFVEEPIKSSKQSKIMDVLKCVE